PDYKFYYVSACWPGSVHDAHVLRNSSLFTKFDGDRWRPIPNAVLLGNSGYPLKEWLVPPLLRPRNDAGARFNIAHKGTRRIVENSFGILKKSFTSLEKLRVDPTFAGEIVKCCCILHNMLLDIRGEEGIEDNYNIVIDPNIKAEETS
uniref:DDE Tnp4 domain-containing protein n=1 Tax=Romanomermis culicivorax TaxID=13658 RepID=A0A915IHC2_ROMCU